MYACVHMSVIFDVAPKHFATPAVLPFSKEKTEVHMLPQDHKHLKELYLGSMGNVGRPSSIILVLCTSPQEQTCGMVEQEDGQSGPQEKDNE